MRQEKTTALPREMAPAVSLAGFLACHCLAGVIAGWIMVGGLLWLDVAGLGGLVMASDLFPVPLLMLLAAFALTFGAVAMGSAIMGLGRSGGSAGVAGRKMPHTRAARKLRSRPDPSGLTQALIDRSLEAARVARRRGQPAWLLPFGACYAARPMPMMRAEAP